MNVLKIATAGSVDDGKSTLIGRILYDTHSLTDDKIEAIERNSRKKGFDYLDFSLATDGLVAEREQGITIDVAHIYFSTDKRSYVIADTPGHVEYTRNMVTGASTSQASIILVDARNGVIEQTKRHFFINNLLRIKDIVVAINKMDLVDFSEEIYNNIKSDFSELINKASYKEQKVTFVPISALKGDNVVHKSDQMPWYKGEALLEHLEQIESRDIHEKAQVRFPIQSVIRPKQEAFHDFRGYSGKVYGAPLSVGDEVAVLPSETQSKVKEIRFFDQTTVSAERGQSILVSLEDDINVTRGNMIVKKNEMPQVSKDITATLCWMDKKSLSTTTKYTLSHGINRVPAKVTEIASVLNLDFSGQETPTDKLELNEIGKIQIKLATPIFFDSYKDNKENGAFILIDPQSNTTSAVGFIE